MHFARNLSVSRLGGFSLVELLVVISIITIMSVLAQPALTSLFQSEGFSGNVIEVSDLVKQARAKAMAQNTFVWLGFAATASNGSPNIIASAIIGKSGLSSDLANNNYVPAMKPLLLRNLQIVNSTGFNLVGFNASNNTDLSTFTPPTAPYTTTFSQSVAGTNTTFTNVIVFGPDGEATLTTAHPYKCIGIGLKGGPAASTNSQIAAIQISGLCGQPSLYRQ